jgi:hypothetical protein
VNDILVSTTTQRDGSYQKIKYNKITLTENNFRLCTFNKRHGKKYFLRSVIFASDSYAITALYRTNEHLSHCIGKHAHYHSLLPSEETDLRIDLASINL